MNCDVHQLKGDTSTPFCASLNYHIFRSRPRLSARIYCISTLRSSVCLLLSSRILFSMMRKQRQRYIDLYHFFFIFLKKRSFNALKMLCAELRFIDKWRQGCIQYSNIYNFLANFLKGSQNQGRCVGVECSEPYNGGETYKLSFEVLCSAFANFHVNSL